MLEVYEAQRFQGAIVGGAIRELDVCEVYRLPSAGTLPPINLRSHVFKARTLANVVRARTALAKGRDVASDFRCLADQWKRETGFMSNTEDIVLNDAYQRILAMGPKALPHIFAELRAEGDDPQYWHWALERLAGVDPTSPDMQGSAKELRSAWLTWASENGFTD